MGECCAPPPPLRPPPSHPPTLLIGNGSATTAARTATTTATKSPGAGCVEEGGLRAADLGVTTSNSARGLQGHAEAVWGSDRVSPSLLPSKEPGCRSHSGAYSVMCVRQYSCANRGSGVGEKTLMKASQDTWASTHPLLSNAHCTATHRQPSLLLGHKLSIKYDQGRHTLQSVAGKPHRQPQP
jgi:hypothetical protein